MVKQELEPSGTQSTPPCFTMLGEIAEIDLMPSDLQQASIEFISIV
jgi:hypothetical protein